MPRALDREELLRERRQVLDKAERTAETPLGKALWSARLSAIEQKIEALGDQARTKAAVALLFEGEPVRGTKEIRVDFAAKVLESFQGIVGVAFAQKAGAKLTTRGRVPLVEQSRLYVRDMARGSVGFILEEADDGQIEAFDSTLKEVVEQSVSLIDAISSPGADADIVSQLSPRVIQVVFRFAEVLTRGHADLRIYSDERAIALPSDRVASMYELLGELHVEENIHSLQGQILGLLPDSGQFEFRVLEDERVIAGDTSMDVQWRYISERGFPERYVMKPVRIKLRHITVSRAGRVQKEAFVLEDVADADPPVITSQIS